MTDIATKPGQRGASARGGEPTPVYRVETEDLGRQVHKILKSMIINGDLRTGEKLVQDDLAERLGVSRTPLLFAFSKLEQENLVETVPRRGFYVRRYSHRELIDIYDIRARLEPLAARDAAKNATAEDLDELARLAGMFDAAMRQNDPQELKRTDYELHTALLRCCGNRFLYDMLAGFNIIIISNTNGLLKPAEQSSREHRDLLDALARRDADGADRAMFQHIDGSRINLMTNASVLVANADASS